MVKKKKGSLTFETKHFQILQVAHMPRLRPGGGGAGRTRSLRLWGGGDDRTRTDAPTVIKALGRWVGGGGGRTHGHEGSGYHASRVDVRTRHGVPAYTEN